ncbi:hypothetical protein D3C87_993840 [compost metagenome]
MALVAIPAVDVLNIEGFAQRLRQFLPARGLVSGIVPEGQLAFSKGNEEQRCAIVEQPGDGLDVDVQMYNRRGFRVQRQEVFALQIVGVGGGEELTHQHLGQRFKSRGHGHERTIQPLPLRCGEHRVFGVDIAFGIQRFEALAQHLRSDFIDGRPLARLMDDQAFFQ